MKSKPKVPYSPASKRKGGDARVHFDLSRTEFLSLLKIVTLGETMANGYRAIDRIREYQDIEQLILGLAEREGFCDLVERDAESGEIFPTRKLDELVSDLTDDFEDASFWEEAAYRLAYRDMVRAFGEKGIKKLTRMRYAEEIFRRSDRYAAELEKHGLERLEIIDPSASRTGS